MDILIVSATELEIKPLLGELQFEKKKSPLLHSYTIGQHKVDVLITGVGMVATAYQLGKTLATETYNFALNLGIAGSFENRYPKKKHKLGEVVNVISDRIAELGVVEGEDFTCMSDLGLIHESDLSFFTEEHRNELCPGCEKIQQSTVLQGLRKVSGVTVNRLDTGKEEIEAVVRRLKPDVETMEGAAFLYAAFREFLPSMQLRAISNYAGERNKKKWKMDEAVKKLNTVALQLLEL